MFLHKSLVEVQINVVLVIASLMVDRVNYDTYNPEDGDRSGAYGNLAWHLYQLQLWSCYRLFDARTIQCTTSMLILNSQQVKKAEMFNGGGRKCNRRT